VQRDGSIPKYAMDRPDAKQADCIDMSALNENGRNAPTLPERRSSSKQIGDVISQNGDMRYACTLTCDSHCVPQTCCASHSSAVLLPENGGEHRTEVTHRSRKLDKNTKLDNNATMMHQENIGTMQRQEDVGTMQQNVGVGTMQQQEEVGDTSVPPSASVAVTRTPNMNPHHVGPTHLFVFPTN
jgi:hypothetical protein